MSKHTHRNRQARTTPAPAPATDAAPRSEAADGFVSFGARLGLGADNHLTESQYLQDPLTRDRLKLESMYRGSWIVGAVVDAIAEDMTRAGVTINSTDPPDMQQQLQTALVTSGVWGDLLDGLKWGRLYGGAIVFVDIDGQDPATPLRIETVAQGQFNGLRVFDRWQVMPDLARLVPNGANAGLPMFYTVVSDVVSGALTNLRIHHTRAIRLLGTQLPRLQAIRELLWGQSVVERMLDRLVSFDAATMGAANLVNRAYLRTIMVDGLRSALGMGGPAEENLVKMFHYVRRFQQNDGLTLLDAKDTFQANSYTFSGLSDVLLQFGQQISGATGIPLVRLFGQSPSGMSATGESDLRNYYDKVAAQQEATLREGLHRVLRVLYQSTFGKPPPADFDFDFVPLWQLSATEKATLATTVSSAVILAYQADLFGKPTAMRELRQLGDSTGVFTNVTDLEIQEAEADLAAPPAPVETPSAADLADVLATIDPTATPPAAAPGAPAAPPAADLADVLATIGGKATDAARARSARAMDRVMAWVGRGK